MATLQPLGRKTADDEIQSLATSTNPSPSVLKSTHQTPDTSITIQTTDDDSAKSSIQRRKDLLLITSKMLPLYFFISATMVFSPLVMILYLLIRLLMLVRHGHDYYSATQLKLFIRIWLFTLIWMVALNLGIGLKLPYHGKQYFPQLTQALSRLPSGLYFLISAICFLSCLLPSILCIFIPYRLPFEHMGSGLYAREGVLEIIDCLLFWWMESKVMKYIPPLVDYKILGLHIQKCIKVSLLVIIGYNVIAIFCHLILLCLRMFVPRTRKIVTGHTDTRTTQLTLKANFTASEKYLVYCFNGMKHSITFILSSLVMLLTWVLYFGSHLNSTPRAKNVLEFGTWTFVSVLICSLLWLIKTCVLLSWEANAVYNRLSSEILKGGNQLYLLGIIGRYGHDIFNIRYKARLYQAPRDDKQVEEKEDEEEEEDDGDDEGNMKTPLSSHGINHSISNKKKPYDKLLSQVYDRSWSQLATTPFHTLQKMVGDRSKSKSDDVDEWSKQGVTSKSKSSSNDNRDDDQQGKYYIVKKLSTRVKERVKDDLFCMQDNLIIPTIDVVQQVSQYLLTARKTLLTETYTSDILHSLESRSKKGIFEENVIQQLIVGSNNANDKMEHEWDYFRVQLNSEEISLETLGEWRDRARTNCLFLANTLSSAEEVADCLNKIISLLIIAATIVIWLLLTGLATTKAFVLIASPILAATFIFGDTSKILFQGIIFTYLVHPFDVGDVCIIDERMMEVKTMGVWRTIFSKVDTQEEVIYTNSQLSTKEIIKNIYNHNWNDCVEIDVAPLDLYKKEIIKFERKIRRYLNNNKGKFTPGHNCVVVLTTGDNIKIFISFRHNNLNPINTTAFLERLKLKQKLRSKFILHVLDILKKVKKERSKLELNKRRKFQWQLNTSQSK